MKPATIAEMITAQPDMAEAAEYLNDWRVVLLLWASDNVDDSLLAYAAAQCAEVEPLVAELAIERLLEPALELNDITVNLLTAMERCPHAPSAILGKARKRLRALAEKCVRSADPFVADQAAELVLTRPRFFFGTPEREDTLFRYVREYIDQVPDELRTGWLSIEGTSDGYLAELRDADREIRRVWSALMLDSAVDSETINMLSSKIAERHEWLSGLSIATQKVRLSIDEQPVFLGSVVETLKRWGRLFISAMDRNGAEVVELVPVATAHGSFILGLRIESEAPAERMQTAFEYLRHWEVVLRDIPFSAVMMADALSAEGVKLTVSHTVVTLGNSQLMTEDLDVDLQRHSAALKRARRTMNQQLETIDVPQADELDRVVRFVKLVANGESVNEKSLGVVSRQVAYYKSAAKILGLLDEEGSLTPAAQHLLRAPKSETDRLLLTYFATSKCGNAWLTWADESQFHDLDPDSAEDFLEQTTKLSQSTRHRRAQTLTAWWHRLAESGQT